MNYKMFLEYYNKGIFKAYNIYTLADLQHALSINLF